MILLIDNYDSFSYNLFQLIGQVNPDIQVYRNDKITVDEITDLNPDCIILSPGPGKPEDAGICMDIVKRFHDKIPILGVCLGHQAICAAFGGEISHAKRLMHGKSSDISLDYDFIFKGLPSQINVGRYHSLSLVEDTLPDCLEIISKAKDDGEVMAVKHKSYNVYGLQFHPESILTPDGLTIIQNFTEKSRKRDIMIKEAILKVYKHEDLTYEEAYQTMDEIMSGEASEVQMSAYLTAMSMKGETIDEITASAEAMRAHCVRLLNDKEVLEIVGTGGDGSNTFNISTTSSIVISAAGVPVAKHGNRSASSKCGAADVLEALGVNIYIEPEKSIKCLREINLCFLFAQNYHLSMKYVANVRKELSIRTIFNILGPLTNPAGATMQVLGVYERELVEPLMDVLKNLGVSSAVSVYGLDGMDEISASDKTFVCELKDGKTMSYEISPEYFGMELASKEDLVGGNAQENADITLSILNGEKGPRRNAVLLNSAAGLYVAGKVESLREGVDLAAEIIDSGKALEQLEKFIEFTNS